LSLCYVLIVKKSLSEEVKKYKFYTLL